MNGPARNIQKGDREEDNLPVPYQVGYGKPPAENRFRKGQSGNPKGRPRGAKNKRPALSAHNQPTDSLILEEAYRMVTIREGGETIELPAIQASMRSLTISAMKGNRLSQKALAEIVREIEYRRAKQHYDVLEVTNEYVTKWRAEIRRCERLGIEPPEPLPHPDDIRIDFRTGEVNVEGPWDEREKKHYDKCIARRAEAQEEVNYCAGQYRNAESDQDRAMWLEEWHFEQRIFDIINDSMHGRYKLKLKNRSYSTEASREGETLREFFEDRKRPRPERRWGDYVED